MDSPTLFLSKTGYKRVKASTNANLTGPVTSVGNATSIADSIALPGSPTTTTQPLGTDNTTIATTEFVLQEIESIDTSDVLYDPDLLINTPTAVTLLQEVINKAWATGITTGGTLIDNTNGTIKIETGEAAIRTAADGTTPIYLVRFDEQTPINLTDDATNYVYFDYNAGSPQFAVSTSETTADEYTKIPAYVIHRAGNVLTYIDARKNNIDGKVCTNAKFRGLTKFLHEEGGSVLGEPSDLAVSLTEGYFRYRSACGPHVTFDTSIAGTDNANVFAHYRRNGSGWTTTTDQKLIDTALWDNNQASPTVLGNNRYGVSWIFVINNTPSSLAVVMGQEEYLNLAAARIATIPSSLPSIITGLGALVGYVIYEKNATSFDAAQNAFTQTFSTSTPTVHNGLSGLQGGTVSEYYHLTAAEHTALGTITDGAVTLAKMADLAQDQFIGRVAASTGVPETATITAAARSVLDDTTVGAMAVTLELEIGVNVQAYDVNTAKTDVAQEYTATQNFNATALTDAATISWNLSVNQVAKVTLEDNRILGAPTNQADGATYILRVIQDGTGSRTLTYNATFKFPGGTAPTLSTGAGAVDILTFISDGTNMYGVCQLDFS
ncbi:hypothetical protein KAR91_18215 [Candidatus Pacearchaeota archaeon]|nr:hypothetical protein [Candidatus Pacearchaeota archaeon]